MMRIAFLGPEGTVSEESARHFFRNEACEFIPYKQISDVFTAVDSGAAHFSVIPIENTIEGSVSLHLDWIVHRIDLPIRAEWIYPSVQHLLGHAKMTGPHANTIERILSHPVAIAQCRDFIERDLAHAEVEHTNSTAEGAKIVASEQEKPWAAIGTRLAAKKYGLDILRENIADHQDNFTRFLLLGRDKLSFNDADLQKTSIVITLPEDYPGALHQVLSAFAWRRINLSRIESRPTKQKLGSYFFVIDIVESMDSVLLPAAIAEIEAIGCQVRILGSYPSYTY